MLITSKLASYEVPHGLNWLIHVKVFNYAGLEGPIHFINVYLKLGGNHRQTQKEQLAVVKNIVAKIVERNGDSRVVVLGDMNEPEKQLLQHLNVTGDKRNYLVPARCVGSRWTHFPSRGVPSVIDNILVTENAQRLFRASRVLRKYDSSDHRPLMMTPYMNLAEAMRRVKSVKPAFDSKMLHLRGEGLVNDNAWTKLMQQAYQEYNVDGDHKPIAGEEWRAEVSNEVDKFIDTFDRVCWKHDVKRTHRLGSSLEFPRKLKALQKTVRKYSKRYHTALDHSEVPDESTCVQLVHAQTRFKRAKKVWRVRMQQQFYSHIADDFIANDHKQVWSRLWAQVNPTSVMESVTPVKNKDGVLQHHANRILQVMKDHYKDLLTYDPEGLSGNDEHWAKLNWGEPKPELEDLNEGLGWPEILLTIRGMNRNTTPGKDKIHVNVLKMMVREDCMMALKKDNPKFRQPDNVFVDLSEWKVKEWLVYPLTNMGKVFHALLNRT